jgi:hypothetical protein
MCIIVVGGLLSIFIGVLVLNINLHGKNP